MERGGQGEVGGLKPGIIDACDADLGSWGNVDVEAAEETETDEGRLDIIVGSEQAL